MKILLFIASYFLLSSCNSRQNSVNNTSTAPIQNSFIASDSLFRDGNNYGSMLWLNNNENYLGVYRPSQQSVTLFELPRYRSLQSYQLKTNLSCVGMSVKKDTLYTYNDNIMYLYSKSGIYVKRLRLPDVNNDNVSINTDLINGPLSFTEENEFTLNIFPLLNIRVPNEKEAYLKSNRIGMFKIFADSIALVNEFAAFPDEMEMQKKYYGWNLPIYTKKNDSIYSYVFKGGYSIYEYNIRTQKTEVYKVKDIPKCNLVPYHDDSIGNFSYSRKHDIENDCLIKLLYDEESSQYVIFKALAVKYINNKELSQWNDKPVDVYVVDRNYTVIKQLRIQDMNTYFINHSFVLYGQLHLIHRIENDKQPIIIDRYEI